MSAFFVSKRTIDNVVMLAKPMHMSGDERANDYGKELIDMNIEALDARYDIKHSGEWSDYHSALEEYVFEEHKDTSEAQQLKSLNCLLYQCSEGDVPETDLFKRLLKLAEDTEQALSKGRQELKFGEYRPFVEGYDDAAWDMA